MSALPPNYGRVSDCDATICRDPVILDRRARAAQKFVQVFGNTLDGDVWASRFYPQLHQGQLSPRDLINESEKGLQAVLAYLDTIAHTVTPRDYQVPRWKPRRRR